MKTVFVGLSGGVDSAVSAALLKEQGHSVVGAFIKIWQPTFLECTWQRDRLDAMRVAAALDIPFREVDLSEEYKKGVIDSLIADYTAGRTPNPDVLCNHSIKFGAFLDWAQKNGADMIATGHYARIRKGDETELLRAIDRQKDQSYFLHRLTKEELSKALFPVGEMTKPEVRAHAQRLSLPVAKKPDSQGLCFVGDVSMRDFLKRYIEVAPGNVLDAAGRVIGEHEGAPLYTIGQRHGFTVRGGDQKTHYVTAIDVRANTITVSDAPADARRSVISLEEPHWITRAPELPLTCEAQARYRERAVAVTISREGDRYSSACKESLIAAPGQSLVLYDGDVCLGGAVIADYS
jgi:tRNA-specific 2-thiouridylase